MKSKDSEKVLPTVRWARRHVKREEVIRASNGMEEALAGFEVREYRISVAALDLLEEGDAVLLDRVPAGATVLWGPRLTESGEALSMAVSVPTGEPLIPEIKVRQSVS